MQNIKILTQNTNKLHKMPVAKSKINLTDIQYEKTVYTFFKYTLLLYHFTPIHGILSYREVSFTRIVIFLEISY